MKNKHGEKNPESVRLRFRNAVLVDNRISATVKLVTNQFHIGNPFSHKSREKIFITFIYQLFH